MMVNAIQAIEVEGEITVKTGYMDEKVYISFIDNGVGIPEENLSRIFDPGFTTKGVGVGTGLGLSISYNIVQKHNGKINVESKLGMGASFTVEIPVIS
jgi:two-component system, NtrC family, sensor kinase